jgi:hypothetical protein
MRVKREHDLREAVGIAGDNGKPIARESWDWTRVTNLAHNEYQSNVSRLTEKVIRRFLAPNLFCAQRRRLLKSGCRPA